MISKHEWEEQLMNKKWLSMRMKHGLGATGYSDFRISEIEKELKNVIEMSPGTYRGSIQPSKLVIEAAKKALDDGFTDYTYWEGLADFRKAVAKKLKRENGIEADPEKHITPTSGCTHAFDMTLRILVDPGDEVMMIDPEYCYFWRKLREHGAKTVPVPLKEPTKPASHWEFDTTALEKRITSRTKMLVMSNGNNPSGKLYSKEELEAVAEIATKNKIFVFSDELYEKVVFDGYKHFGIASLPGMAEYTITAIGFSKMQAMSGFRVGFAVANEEITRHMKWLVGHTVECVNSVGQKAAIAAMSEEMDDWHEEILSELQRRRDFAVARLNKIGGIVCNLPVGSYFLFPNISKLGTSQEVAEFFLREGRVKVLLGTDYGQINGEGHIRISFCAGWDRLAEGLERIAVTAEKLLAQKRR